MMSDMLPFCLVIEAKCCIMPQTACGVLAMGGCTLKLHCQQQVGLFASLFLSWHEVEGYCESDALTTVDECYCWVGSKSLLEGSHLCSHYTLVFCM